MRFSVGPFGRVRRTRLTGLSLAVFLAACSPSPPPVTTAPDRVDLLEGRVLEQLDAPPYSFLRVKTVSQEVWTAVPVGTYGVGSTVAMRNGVAVRNHLIRSQNRRLEVVYFGQLGAGR